MDSYPTASSSFFVMNGFLLSVADTTILVRQVELISPINGKAHLYLSVGPEGKWVLINSSLFTESDIMLVPLFSEN